jgi:hypothetical protein
MADDHIDQMLRELSMAVDALHAEYAATRTRVDRLDEEMESLLERSGRTLAPTHVTPRPDKALLTLRLRLAERSAREHRDACRALLAWWVDAVTLTVVYTMDGVMPDPVRIAGADPGSWMDADDLARLPAISTFDRDLAELAFSMARGGPASPCGSYGSDFAVMAKPRRSLMRSSTR